MRKAGLQLVDRLGGDPRREDLVEPFESVMVSLQSRHAGLDRQTRPGRLGDRGQAGKHRQISIRMIVGDRDGVRHGDGSIGEAGV